jgi:hypothetical protein
MSRRDDLLRACAQGDELALRRAGWVPVWEALKTWWPKAFASTDMRPYVTLLVDEPPDRLVAALEAWTKTKRGQFRPSPAEVMHALHGDEEHDGLERHPALARDPAATPRALAAVARTIEAGEPDCSCGFHRSVWNIDAEGVLRCRECGGGEPGQRYAAEDAGLIGEAA